MPKPSPLQSQWHPRKPSQLSLQGQAALVSHLKFGQCIFSTRQGHKDLKSLRGHGQQPWGLQGPRWVTTDPQRFAVLSTTPWAEY